MHPHVQVGKEGANVPIVLHDALGALAVEVPAKVPARLQQGVTLPAAPKPTEALSSGSLEEGS